MDTYRLIMFPIYLVTLFLLWIGITDFIRVPHISKDPQLLLREKTRIFPRITLACIACMYLHLLAIALRLLLFNERFFHGDYLYYFFCAFMVICILSGLNLITVQMLYDCGMVRQMKRSWIILKLTFLPFLALNSWLYWNSLKSVPYYNSITRALFLILTFFIPLLIYMLPYVFPLAMNVASGCIGINYIRHIRKQTAGGRQPSQFHFFLQMIPGLDCLSMIYILLKYKENKLDTEAAKSVLTEDKTADSSNPAPTKRPTLYAKLYRVRKLLFLIYLCCGILFYFRSELAEPTGEIYEEIPAEKTTFYEMTEEETAIMQISCLDDKVRENVIAGQLTDRQAYQLENLRICMQNIETKYPDGLFHVTRVYVHTSGVSDSFEPPPIEGFVFSVSPVSSDEEEYKLNLYPEPHFAIEDNLYAYLHKDSYFRYMEEQTRGEIPGFAKFDTDNWYDWYLLEYDDPATLTAEAVLDGTYHAGPRSVNVYIAADGKSSEECEAQEEALTGILHRIDLPVERYKVYFYDLTLEELAADDIKPASPLASIYINGKSTESSP